MSPPERAERPITPPSGLADAMTVAVCLIDRDHVVHYANSAAEQLFGVGRRWLIGHALDAPIAVDRAWLDHLAIALDNDRAFTVRELTLTPRYSTGPRYVDATITPWPGETGGARALVELVPVDRQLRIVREAALEAQEEANRRVLRGVAHEVRNPLAGLRGAAQLLEQEVADPGVQAFTGVIVREVDRLRDLVERMVGPVRPPAFDEVNLHRVSEHVRSLLRGQAPDDVVVDSDYDPSIPPVEADADQLIQALLNLGRNALEAVGTQGRVTLRTYTLRQFTVRHVRHRLVAVLAVADNGPGVPQHMRETLFQPMVTGRPEGTGLGLTVAQSLAARHGGLIESESSAAGAEFRLLLPLDRGHG
jgi:two-component system nitrogen regulation sensor histidine kinase GlnL